MKRIVWLLIVSTVLITIAPSCNHNKIACPTYADSFPEAKKKKSKKPEEPNALPKGGKATLSITPPGMH